MSGGGGDTGFGPELRLYHVMFTDIEGSTPRWEGDPDGMRRIVREHDELLDRLVDDAGGRVLKRTGDGLGGVLGLVIWILLNPVSAFVIPSEVGKMYAKDGKPAPMTGWTGLWLFPGAILIIPAIVWFVKVQGALNRYWGEAQTERSVEAVVSGES